MARRRNPAPVSANVTVDWKTIGMAGAVFIVIILFLKKQAKDAASAAGEALDITSSKNIISRGAEAVFNPGGLRKDPMTQQPLRIGSTAFYRLNPDQDPAHPHFRYKKDAKGKLVNYDAKGNYIYANLYGATVDGLGWLPRRRRMMRQRVVRRMTAR